MRTAVLSDVHANLEALRAVLDDASVRHVDAVLCLGDLVGYGADPGPCLDLLFESCSTILAGNHDLAASGRLDPSRFSPSARESVAFARRRLTRSQRQRLASLPDEATHEDLLLVHASPADPKDFPYIRDVEVARTSFDRRAFQIAFYGHTHVPLVFHDDGRKIELSMRPHVELASSGRYLCNVGSVGQPRDQDARACYAIHDSAARLLSFHRVEYDVEAAAAKIREAGLPEPLGARLLVGV